MTVNEFCCNVKANCLTSKFFLKGFSNYSVNIMNFYFPRPEQIQFLRDKDWEYSGCYGKPQWLGFCYENKPYKLEMCTTNVEKFSRIEKVINPYLQRAFELKQSQSGLSTTTVYHGTVDHNINSIAENNFNWRLAGRSRGFKHGKGVCFSRRIEFAEQFCKGQGRRMIQAIILCSRSNVGYVGDELPRNGSDTAQSPNGNVLVKFEDSEFLPLFIYHYAELSLYSPFNLGDLSRALNGVY